MVQIIGGYFCGILVVVLAVLLIEKIKGVNMGFRKSKLDDGRTVYELDSPIEKEGRVQVWRIYKSDDGWTIGASDAALIEEVESWVFPSRPDAMMYVSEQNSKMIDTGRGDYMVRRGRFEISAQFLMTIPHNMALVSNIQIETFKAVKSGLLLPGNGSNPQQQHNISFECTGISEYFQEIDDGTEPPKYIIKFAEDHEGRIGMMAEREG